MADITNTYSTAGTFSDTIPANCIKVVLKAWGGGGAGAGSTTGSALKAGGSGAQCVIKTINNPIYGQALSIIVAALRSGTTGNAANGNDSYVTVNAVEVCRAKGGASAVNNVPGVGSTSGGVGDLVYSGGNGGVGGSGTQGGGGAGADSNGNGANAINQAGGNSIVDGGDGGNGANADTLASINGFSGSAPGGAGGGGYMEPSQSNGYGGNGALGRVIVIYTINESKHHFIL